MTEVIIGSEVSQGQGERDIDSVGASELVINLKTATQIGLTIPQWTLIKADRVIK